VSTTVIEVGVDVPNASVMLVENAERFGLSQLHQLRGRILRSSHKPYCFVFAESKSQKTIDRLKSFVNAKNGFELAEADLEQRGAGDLAGAKQWGISDLAMEALKNIKMVEAARLEARALIEKDFELKTHPSLQKYLSQKSSVHME
jgi:ATP-dependent DNA helicase RecG